MKRLLLCLKRDFQKMMQKLMCGPDGSDVDMKHIRSVRILRYKQRRDFIRPPKSHHEYYISLRSVRSEFLAALIRMTVMLNMHPLRRFD